MRCLAVVVSELALISTACGPAAPPAVPAPGRAPVAEPGPGADPNAWPEPAAAPAGEPDVRPDPDPDPAPAPAATRPRGPAGPGGTGQALLDEHNRVRAAHCAAPLAWSNDLAKVAQGWADQLVAAGCAFEHNTTRYGENLAAGTSGALSPASVVDMWYREIDSFDFARGGFSMSTGHFTQVVWTTTQRLGCGVASCKGMDLYVCNYDPPGNVQGQYRTHVKPTGCK